MQKIIKLDLNDIKELIADYYDVNLADVTVTSAGRDMGDGPGRPGGYFCYIEVKEDNNKKYFTKPSDNSAWDYHYDGSGDYREGERCFYGDFS